MYKEVLGYSNYKINRYGDIKNLKNIKKNKVVVINYLDTGKTRLYFDTKKDFYNYMLEKTNTNLNLKQLTSIKYYNNYKFYRGIMYQFYNNLEDIMDWGCISLQNIYNSKFNIPSNSKLYKLEIDGTICYVRGLNKLANMLKSYIKTEINNIVSVEDLKSNLNQNNITIEDCDKIIIKI